MLTEYWRIQLFGDLRAIQGEQHIKRFRAQKYGLLLAYLAYYGKRSHPREELVNLLWPDAEPAAGRLNLRVALNSLRKQLEPPGIPRGSVLVTEGDALRLHPDAYVTDVQVFERALKAAEQATELTECRDHLSIAADAYQGRLLPGFYEDWVSVEQSRLEERYQQALHRLIETLEQLGEMAQALDYAHQAVGLNPLDEAGHQFLIRLYLRAGQPSAAQRQFHELERILREQLGVKPSATTCRLLEGTEYSGSAASLPREAGARKRLVLSEKSPTAPLLAKRAPAICLLPPTLNRFFGREAELSALEDRLSDAGNRLVTIVGTGGAGKTRLAIEAARHFADRFSGPVVFVSLSGTIDPEYIPEAIRSTLRLPITPNTLPIEQVIAFFLQAETTATEPVLLVLDNLEHLLAVDAIRTVESVQTLLARLPRLTLLVTSRQPIQLAGEARFPLSALPVPTLPGTPARLREFAGIQLFVERAQAVRPDFQITTRNVAAVTELCRRLDGLPLAIELAAAWAQTLTPLQMLERLAHRFQMLVSRQRDAAPRHRSLHAAIASSYALLPPEAQRLFRQLSVFRGGFTLEAAKDVCHSANAEPPNALPFEERLSLLQEHSLLEMEDREGQYRFSLLESLREFAGEQLNSEQTISLSEAHAAWCCQMVRTATKADRKDLPRWMPVLLREQSNWRAALEFCFRTLPRYVDPESADQEPMAARLGMLLVVDLYWYWRLRGDFDEGRRWLERTLDHVGTCMSEQEAEQAHCCLGSIYFLQGDIGLAKSHLLASLARCKADWKPTLKANILCALGQVYGQQNDFAKAEEAFLEAVALFTEAEEWILVVGPLDSLSNVARKRGDLLQARLYIEEALRFTRGHGDVRSMSRSLNSLGTITFEQLDYGAAEKYYAEGLTMMRTIGDRMGIANSLGNLSMVAACNNDHSLALSYALESLTIRKEIQAPEGIAISLVTIAGILKEREPLLALRIYAAVQTMFEKYKLEPPPAVRGAIHDALVKIRAEVPGADAVWNLGRLLSPEAAVEEALHLCSERAVPTGDLLLSSVLPT